MGFGGSGSGNTCIGTLPTYTISGRNVGLNEIDCMAGLDTARSYSVPTTLGK